MNLKLRIVFVAVPLLCFFALFYLNATTPENFVIQTQNEPKPRYAMKPEFNILNGPNVSALDPRVLAKLKTRYLIPPLTRNLPYNLTNKVVQDPSMGQSQIIRLLFSYLPNDEDGFFVECGALDGETRSNTLYLEHTKKWNGLLIEADPLNFEKMLVKRRKAWLSRSCLSTKSYPEVVSFEQLENQGKISAHLAGYIKNGFVDIQCFPFESYMSALNRTHIDYFSLDVEGAELQILKTISFLKYDISALSVEFIHDVEGKIAIEQFMKFHEYSVLAEVTHPEWLANDFIFVKNSFLKKYFSDSQLAELKRIIAARVFYAQVRY